MKRIAFFLALSLLSVTGFTDQVSAAESPRCVQDDLSRQVCTDKPIQRIISLAPSVTELVYAAGGGEKVIAVDDHSDYPEAVQALPRVGGYPNTSVEAILSKKPDLVMIWSGGNDSRLSAQLENIGLNVFYADPIDFDGIASVIRRMGKIMGTEAVAEKNADVFYKQYESIRKQFSDAEPVNVFFEIWNNPLMTVNGDQIISQVIELCGGVNVFATARPRVPKVGIEAVLAQNPDAIVSSKNVQGGHDIQSRWQKYPQIKAVKNGFLFTIPGDLITRASPRVLKGAEVLCQQLQDVRAFKKKSELTPVSNAENSTAQGKQ
ncbi:cobalamin-binding protein [Endozoicomonas gorgoniicola]|uniref:Cobalamin-binding protein n=1 Tax=Endozoicomonas gorgoniicola TaxID=1234144 RepID=A0ABT3MZ23_9GAMM|nr:cobalamin-binding protein [Endozoicomonas gorgoniicola]MCW7554631.1 cobalamin-binding protein [Endozoicomonas gorgoniicola]